MLSLDPRDELVFPGSFKHIACQKLVIGNPSKDQRVSFKLKATTPRMFLVRPNIGVLGPGESVTVDIFMQPIPTVPQKGHKFFVQAAVTSDDVTNLPEFWKAQRSANIWEAKIKCEIESNEQPGGVAAVSPENMIDVETEFDVQEVTDSVAKLLKQVSMLQDDSLTLKEKIYILRQQDLAVDHDQRMMRRFQQRGRTLGFTFCAVALVGAMVGVLYAKYYL